MEKEELEEYLTQVILDTWLDDKKLTEEERIECEELKIRLKESMKAGNVLNLELERLRKEYIVSQKKFRKIVEKEVKRLSKGKARVEWGDKHG